MFPLTDQTPKAQVTAVYVAYFGRAPDPQGLNFWIGEFNDAIAAGATNEEVLNNISESFRLDTEAQDLFSFFQFPNLADQTSIGNFVNQVFQNLFNRDAEGTVDDVATGLGFWTNEIQERLDAGINIGDIIVDIISGAQDSDTAQDATTIANKIEVAQAYVDAYVNTQDADWTADDDIQGARDVIADVNETDQSVTDGVAEAEQLAADDAQPDQVDGRTFTLTGGSDTLTPDAADDTRQTTAGDDLIRGVTDGDLDTADFIDAGGGADVLRAVMEADGNDDSVSPVLESVERVELDVTDDTDDVNDSVTFDAGDSTGIEEIRVDNLDAGADGTGTNAATIQGISTDVEVGFKDAADGNGGSSLTVTYDGVGGEADSGGVTAYGGTLGTLDIANVETVKIDSQTGANTIGTLIAGAATALTVTGDQDLTITSAFDFAGTDEATVNASGFSSGTFTADFNATDNAIAFTGGSGDADLTLGGQDDTVTGGDGAETVVLGAGNDTANTGGGDDDVDASGAGDVTVGAGVGDDNVTVAAATLDENDSIDGGDGTDTVETTSADASTIAGDTNALSALSNFEGLSISDGFGATVDISKFGTSRLELGGGANGGTVNNFASDGTVVYEAASAGALTVNVPGATGAGTPNDTLNIELAVDVTDDSTGGSQPTTDFDSITADGVNLLNINTADTDPESTDPDGGLFQFGVGGNPALDVITVTGDVDLQLTGNVPQQVETVEASSFNGALTLDISNNSTPDGVQINGGAGDDSLTGGLAGDSISGGDGADTLSGEAGNDILSGGAGDDILSGGTGVDSLTGGDGSDTFQFLTAGDSTTSALDTVADFVIGDSNDALDFDTTDDDTTTDDAAAVVDTAGEFANGVNQADLSGAADLDAALAIVEGQTIAATEVASFEFNGNTYVFQEDAGDGDGSVANIVELTGVTGVTSINEVGGTDAFTLA